MSYTFEVRFAGLCAFVPELPLDASSNRVTVLLADPKAAGAESVLSRTIAPHSALLRFSLDDLPGVTGARSGLSANHELVSSDIKFYRCRSGEDSSQARPLDYGVTIACTSRGAAESPRSADEMRDFTWIPCIDEILPEAEINPDLLQDDAFSLTGNKVLAARIYLGQGELRTEIVARHNDSPVVTRFVPSLLANQQALAQWATLSVSVEDDFDVLVRERIAGGEERDLVRLHPGGTVTRIEISNLCCGHYIEDGISKQDRLEQDFDFEAHYLHCKDVVALKKKVGLFPIPVPVYYAGVVSLLEDRVGGGGGVNCNLAYYRGISDAWRRTKAKADRPQSAAPEFVRPVEALPAVFQRLSPLGQPVAMLAFASSAPSARLTLAMKSQVGSQLCWAAIASYVVEHYDKKLLQQCEIVGEQLGLDGCCPDCKKTGCDAPWSTAKALASLGHLQGDPVEGPVSFQEIQHEISQERPIIAGIGKSSSDHVVMINGWTQAGGEDHIWIADPKNGSVRLWKLEDFKVNSGFRWKATYKTI